MVLPITVQALRPLIQGVIFKHSPRSHLHLKPVKCPGALNPCRCKPAARVCVCVCARSLSFNLPDALFSRGVEGERGGCLLQPARGPPRLSWTPNRTDHLCGTAEADLLTSEPKRLRSLSSFASGPPSWWSGLPSVHPAGCRIPPAGSKAPSTRSRAGKACQSSRSQWSRMCPTATWIFWV